jgi:hypothetical protein
VVAGCTSNSTERQANLRLHSVTVRWEEQGPDPNHRALPLQGAAPFKKLTSEENKNRVTSETNKNKIQKKFVSRNLLLIFGGTPRTAELF